MDIELTEEQAAFAREIYAHGRAQSLAEATDLVRSKWAEYQIKRAELVATIEAADASLDRGEGTRIHSEQELHEFFQSIHNRGTGRLNSTAKAS